MSEQREVELLPAFMFICEDCGTETFVRAIAVEDGEFQKTAIEEFRRVVEMTDGAEAASEWDGTLLMAPTEVTCPHCQQTFTVSGEEFLLEDAGMFLDDDDDDLFEDDDDLGLDDEDLEDLDFEEEDDEDLDDEDDEEDFDDEVEYTGN